MKPTTAMLLATAMLSGGLAGMTHAAELTQRNWAAHGVTHWELSLPAEFVLKQARDSQIRITAEPKVLQAIAVRIQGNRAEINTSGSFSTQKKLLVEISAPDFQRIGLHDSGSLQLASLRGQRLQFAATDSASAVLNRLHLGQLQIEMADSASVDANGQAGDQLVKVEDSASYRAASLQSATAKATVSGSGDARLAVTKTLNANVSDAGTLKYRGNPGIRQQVDDAGTLEQE